MPLLRRVSFCLVLPALLAGCGEGAANGGDGAAPDPASQQALSGDILTDPDLSASNEAGAALSASGGQAIPEIDMSPAAVAAARKRALTMVGGTMPAAPAARAVAADAPDSPAMVRAARAAVAPGGAQCAGTVSYSAAWAAKLPPAFPVYPRGNTVEAAGSDEGQCALRIVTFRSPVPVADILAFYAARAAAAGFGADHVTKGAEAILSGTNAQAAYVVYARKLPGGASEIDLVTTAN